MGSPDVRRQREPGRSMCNLHESIAKYVSKLSILVGAGAAMGLAPVTQLNLVSKQET